MGLRVVAQNSVGQVVGMAVCRCSVRWDASMAEAAAVRFNVLVAGRLGSIDIILESDTEQVVRCINSDVAGYAPIFLFYDAVKKARVCFHSFSINHVKRTRKIVAHLVARWDIAFDSDYVCFDSFPQIILALAKIDFI